MAPRRQKKVGMMRIDAAIDALLPYGFSKETICSTVKKLLKVYDDAAAWHIIEEDTYRLVIETILEEQEEKAREEQRANEEAKASEGPSLVAEANLLNSSLDLDCSRKQSVSGEGQSALAVRECDPRQLESGSGSHQTPRPRRTPCYGWISEDEDEDVPQERAVEGERPQRARKRPSGWDVKPSHM
ncbi:uncharacterized protein LOC103990200 [Musa acuminata AAA Group]|uniref:(wild Malaysian banana) hypothetical protein n=1 Tax=Musa acuminata subsp. malaccensis TaxID=214687 RepID=A0A804JP47_MUSAM|nr:PREDICTED: uncharacterized protein LOC103990200 isoform X1 [Musa acuminata subsp. malaccensis]XP_018682825.1 PREDICTED: uncharacterized protein LOC103990200 isoform X1 [Musa acuminata subsp. malaccensis]XP_018682826.1 PREDICTED: uncharacterized protein LOC103990200 isoform X1 [Musa acuminata subsp. malaccensis]XP_018682827.1 PREDICTED: uncharacterized protein LOC103990200 isoform X1 [Musa acuminata subsp. malaccensis]CAG1848392.1 unnamed protein product [Musa acuminata subsp. malaccensis]